MEYNTSLINPSVWYTVEFNADVPTIKQLYPQISYTGFKLTVRKLFMIHSCIQYATILNVLEIKMYYFFFQFCSS